MHIQYVVFSNYWGRWQLKGKIDKWINLHSLSRWINSCMTRCHNPQVTAGLAKTWLVKNKPFETVWCGAQKYRFSTVTQTCCTHTKWICLHCLFSLFICLTSTIAPHILAEDKTYSYCGPPCKFSLFDSLQRHKTSVKHHSLNHTDGLQEVSGGVGKKQFTEGGRWCRLLFLSER